MAGKLARSVDGVSRAKTRELPFQPLRGWRPKLRPCAPALIGLALLVFLWGLGYKLSLYHHASKSLARPTIAKLWTGPRVPQLVLAPASGHAQHAPFGAHADSAAGGALPRLRAAAAACLAPAPRVRPSRRFLSSPRSPPSFLIA